MEIQAIWENGVFKPLTPIKLNRSLVTIKLNDEMVTTRNASVETSAPPSRAQTSSDPSDLPDGILARLRKIHEAILSLPEDQLPPVSEKQLDRVAAMEMRDGI